MHFSFNFLMLKKAKIVFFIAICYYFCLLYVIKMYREVESKTNLVTMKNSIMKFLPLEDVSPAVDILFESPECQKVKHKLTINRCNCVIIF